MAGRSEESDMFKNSGRLRRLLGAALTASLVVLLVAAPVSADLERGHKGHVGYHALVDTEAKAGARCVYRTISETASDYEPEWILWQGRLRRLEVKPPAVRTALAATQKVGWRFIIQRAKDDGAFKRVYRSPIQVQTLRVNRTSSFLPMGVNLTVPKGSRHENHHQYRVMVKMFWYGAGGTVSGSALHQVSWYELVLRGKTERTWIPTCDAWSSWHLVP
jgi:hypothetical protein